eukprot:Pgem_evm1s9974
MVSSKRNATMVMPCPDPVKHQKVGLDTVFAYDYHQHREMQQQKFYEDQQKQQQQLFYQQQQQKQQQQKEQQQLFYEQQQREYEIQIQQQHQEQANKMDTEAHRQRAHAYSYLQFAIEEFLKLLTGILKNSFFSDLIQEKYITYYLHLLRSYYSTQTKKERNIGLSKCHV